MDVIALTFWMLALLLTSQKCGTPRYELLVGLGIGALSVMAVFSWITVVMVMPIVGFAYLERLWKHYKSSSKLPMICCLFLGTVIGMLFCASILLGPFWGRFHDIIRISSDVSKINLPQTSHFLLKDFFVWCASFPYLILLGMACLILRMRSYAHLLAFCVFALICVNTRIYVFRMLYFFPFALTGILLFLADLKAPMFRRGILIILVGIAMMEFSWSIVLRNGSELFVRRFRDYDAVCQNLQRLVGTGTCVINDSYQLYYIGRELGWRQYNSSFRPLRLLKQMEKDDECRFYVCEKKHLTTRLEEELAACGFSGKHIACEYEENNLNPALNIIQKKGRLFTMGPYCVFTRGE